jgi:fructose-bisphosphate aldolase class II
LHGGSGIPKADIQAAIRRGIAKINIGTAIRQPYEQLRDDSLLAAKQAVYDATLVVLRDDLAISGTASLLNQP